MTMKKVRHGDLTNGTERLCTPTAGRSLGDLRTNSSARRLVWQRTSPFRQPRMSAWADIRLDQRYRLGTGAVLFSLREDDPVSTETVVGSGQLPYRLEAIGG